MTRTGRSGIVLPATLVAVRDLGPWLRRLVDDEPRWDEAHITRIELALHEICVNVVEHSYAGDESGSIDVAGWFEPDGDLRLEVTDHGRPFTSDLAAAATPAAPQVRGYGLALVHQLVDDVTYRRLDGTNVWGLRASQPDPRPPAAPGDPDGSGTSAGSR